MQPKSTKSGACRSHTSSHTQHGQKKQWNFRKANWDRLSASEKSIPIIPGCGIPIDEADSRFTKAAYSFVPRGVRTMYVPYMEEKAQGLIDEYEKSGDPDIADQ